jgi:hypothetical protein
MRRVARAIADLPKVLLVAICLLAPVVHAEEIEVRAADLHLAAEGLVLGAEFNFVFPPRLAEAVENGVPLYFLVEFEMTRPRWYWADERTAGKRLQLRLSYHALSRQYLLSNGPLELQFPTLEGALAVLRRVRNWVVGDRIALVSDARYEAGVRMRLDPTLLPKPIQVSAFTSDDWRFESAWKRFAYRTPQIQAPVESRDVKEEEAPTQ